MRRSDQPRVVRSRLRNCALSRLVRCGLYPPTVELPATPRGVAEHHDQPGVEMLHRILDATQNNIVEDVARHADDEHVSQALIEQKFWWNTRVRAAENHGKRVLTGLQFFAARQGRVRVLLLCAARSADFLPST